MLSASAIAQGAVSGLVTHHVIAQADKAARSLSGKDGDPTDNQIIIALLARLVALTAPTESLNRNETMQLQAYPAEYLINEDWYGKSHVCLFLHEAAPLRMDIEGVGTYLKTIGPGWVLLDVRARLSTTDGLSHSIMISYRNDSIGVAI